MDRREQESVADRMERFTLVWRQSQPPWLYHTIASRSDTGKTTAQAGNRGGSRCRLLLSPAGVRMGVVHAPLRIIRFYSRFKPIETSLRPLWPQAFQPRGRHPCHIDKRHPKNLCDRLHRHRILAMSILDEPTLFLLEKFPSCNRGGERHTSSSVYDARHHAGKALMEATPCFGVPFDVHLTLVMTELDNNPIPSGYRGQQRIQP